MIFKRRKAVSPVIATVILVAVAITVAVGVSYWMGGISAQYTSFEKVEIQTAVCTWNGTAWEIEIKLKNSGTATSTLNSVFINEKEVDTYNVTSAGGGEANTNMTEATTIVSGASAVVYIYIDGPPAPQWESVTAGTTVNIKIHSAGGMDYIKLIELV